mmetsp:Transcript_119316/g.234384  ORF Transcript_119316/g.234384 Transcript_119316/m.234384 type:complete len:123 (+) Transcript_119316:207-575(+)
MLRGLFVISILLFCLIALKPIECKKRKWYRIDQSKQFNNFVDKVFGGCVGFGGACDGHQQEKDRADRRARRENIEKNRGRVCNFDDEWNRNHDCHQHNEYDCTNAGCCWTPNKYNWCVQPKW